MTDDIVWSPFRSVTALDKETGEQTILDDEIFARVTDMKAVNVLLPRKIIYSILTCAPVF